MLPVRCLGVDRVHATPSFERKERSVRWWMMRFFGGVYVVVEDKSIEERRVAVVEGFSVEGFMYHR